MLVVGGGPAGFAAALAARRAGAEVLLVERYNHLGGLSTGGLVIWIDRMTDWSGRPVITGIGQELLDRLPETAVAGAPRALWGSTDAERGRLLARAAGRVPRHRHVVADDRPGVAEVPVGRAADRGRRQVPAAQLGRRSARRGPRDPRRDVREQGGPARDPGRRDRRLHRRSRPVRAGGARVRGRRQGGRRGHRTLPQHRLAVGGRRFRPLARVQARRPGRAPAVDGRRRRRARVRRAPGRRLEQATWRCSSARG